MKIVLLRHGKPKLSARRRIRSCELGSWIDAYNAAGIENVPPPDQSLNIARTCRVIVTSDLARAVESGKALGEGVMTKQDMLFREAGLPYGVVSFLKLPPMAWAGFFRLLWFTGFETNGESLYEFRERAGRAAALLSELAREHRSVLLVGHGFMNGFIARELRSAGWNGPTKPPSRHWTYAEYTR